MNKILLFFFITITTFGYSQNISGLIKDIHGNPIPSVNISIDNKNIGVISKENGSYSLNIEPDRSILIIYSFIGYENEKIRIPMLKKNENYILNITLKSANTVLNDIIIKDKQSRKQSLTKIKTKHVSVLPSNTGGIEAILKTLPGVSSTNELSSQYSVRGGNFDENLVYVNGIEIYRPFLIHTGKQEGLSFVNTDMVQNILFSAGGFEAKYGDKMSSVLDIKYKKPIKQKTSLQLSLLGANAYSEGRSKSTKLSYVIGGRYKTTKYLLNAMDTKADYQPRFADIQTHINYHINSKWEVSFLGNINQNQYKMKPEDRETEFGTINEALKLKIYFEGQEIDQYTTYFGALNNVYRPYKNIKLEFITSSFHTFEQENFDILSEYWLYQLENNLGSDEFGNIAFDRGVGKHLNHARNNLTAHVINFSHKGNYTKNRLNINWGIRMQKEKIEDQISEWLLIDSAFYNYPHPNDNIGDSLEYPYQEIVLNNLLKKEINLSSYRNSGHIQFSKDLYNLTINAGTRASYWTYNEELLLSPRISIAYAPIWKKDIIFRSATGIYYQSPFYKELRTINGTLKHDIKAQKSTHYVIGSDYLFYKWGRPFKWVTEIYYKDLVNLIPYKVENVHIQYLPNNTSNGYAKGIDIKLNGEFVNGVESWVSVSVMKTEEDIVGDTRTDENGNTYEIGFIPRPTDQRVNFNLFFQDYIPRNPNYKMHLNMIYGSGLPFGPPKSEKHEDILRIPDYRRVDIGFSAVLKTKDKKSKFKWLNKFQNIWISTEVFNLLDINNTISYLWVADISGRQYAVPNYLTKRQLNCKIILSF